MTGVLIKGGIWEQRQTCREGTQCEETQAEDSHQQAKERDLQQILPSKPSEGTNYPAAFRLLDSTTVRQYISVVLSHLVYGSLLQLT